MSRLSVELAFSANTSQAKKALADLKNDLNSLAVKTPTTNTGALTKDLLQAGQAAAQLKVSLDQATNVNTGKLNLNAFNQQLKKSGMSITEYGNQLKKLGPVGAQAFEKLTSSIISADTALTTGNKLLHNFGITIMNVAKYQLSQSIYRGITESISSAYNYAKDLNKSLNEIRIVTGQSKDQMDAFAERANKAAKALSTTTKAYADASLIFYQQGLSDKEVEARTNVTIKMANAAGESAKTVSDQLTAIWNNFYDGSKSLEYYADVITALGAATASSTSEISQGLEKFAAIAETVGLSYEYATAALATVTAETRQSADVVGTAFKTLFARLQDLELGDTLDDGTSLGKYSKALLTAGVDIKTVSGEMKSMDQILTELGAKWNDLSKDTQIAVAQTVGGTRQYTQLIALMDNWDVFQRDLMIAQSSEGELQKQADIYAESWEAASKRVKASAESIYNSLLDDDAFIAMTDGFSSMLTQIGDLLDAFGGMRTLLPIVTTLLLQFAGPQIANGITQMAVSIRSILPDLASASKAGGGPGLWRAVGNTFLGKGNGLKTFGTIANENAKQEALSVQENMYDTSTNEGKARQTSVESMSRLQEMVSHSNHLSDAEKQLLDLTIERQRIRNEELITAGQILDQKQEELKLQEDLTKAAVKTAAAEANAKTTQYKQDKTNFTNSYNLLYNINNLRRDSYGVSQVVGKVLAPNSTYDLQTQQTKLLKSFGGLTSSKEQLKAANIDQRQVKEIQKRLESTSLTKDDFEQIVKEVEQIQEAIKLAVISKASDMEKAITEILSRRGTESSEIASILSNIKTGNQIDVNKITDTFLSGNEATVRQRLGALRNDTAEQLKVKFGDEIDLDKTYTLAAKKYKEVAAEIENTKTALHKENLEEKTNEESIKTLEAQLEKYKNELEETAKVLDIITKDSEEASAANDKLKQSITSEAKAQGDRDRKEAEARKNEEQGRNIGGRNETSGFDLGVQTITQTARAISGLASSIQMVIGLGSIWQNENASAGEKVLNTIISVSGAIPMLSMGLQGLGTAWKLLGDAAVKAEMEMAPFLGMIGLVAVAIGAVVAAAVILIKNYNRFSEAAEKASKRLQEQKEYVNNLKTEYDNLTATLDTLGDQTKTIDKMIKGTQEWNNAVRDLNQSTFELLEKYPELYKYLDQEKFKEGIYTFDESAQEEILALKNNEYSQALSRQLYFSREANRAIAKSEFVDLAREVDTVGGTFAMEDAYAAIATLGNQAFYDESIIGDNSKFNQALLEVSNSNYELYHALLDNSKAIKESISKNVDLLHSTEGLTSEMIRLTNAEDKQQSNDRSAWYNKQGELGLSTRAEKIASGYNLDSDKEKIANDYIKYVLQPQDTSAKFKAEKMGGGEFSIVKFNTETDEWEAYTSDDAGLGGDRKWSETLKQLAEVLAMDLTEEDYERYDRYFEEYRKKYTTSGLALSDKELATVLTDFISGDGINIDAYDKTLRKSILAALNDKTIIGELANTLQEAFEQADINLEQTNRDITDEFAADPDAWYASKFSKAGIQADEMETLVEAYKEYGDAAKAVALVNTQAQKGLNDLNAVYKENTDALSIRNEKSAEYIKAQNAMTDATGKAFGADNLTYKELQESLGDTANAMDVMALAATGDIKAIEQLRQAAAKSIVLHLGVDDEIINTLLNAIGDNELSTEDLNAFNEYLANGKINIQEAQAIAGNLGYALTSRNGQILSATRYNAEYNSAEFKTKALTEKTAEDTMKRYQAQEAGLKRVNAQLKTYNNLINDSFGADKLNAIDQTIAKNNELLGVYEDEYKEAKKWLNEDAKRAAQDFGLEFDSNGFINEESYKQIYTELYNAANGPAPSDEAKQKLKALEEVYSNYYDDVSKIYELQANQEETIRQNQELALQKITEKVDMQMDLIEGEQKLIEYAYNKLDNGDYRNIEALGLNLTQQVDNQLKTAEVLEQKKADLEASFANNEIGDAQYYNGLKQLREESLNAAQSLQDLDKQLLEYYKNAVSLVAETIDQNLEKFENINTTLDHYKKIMDLTGLNKDYDLINSLQEAQIENTHRQMRVSKEAYEMMHEEAERQRAELEQIRKTGTEEEIYNQEQKLAEAEAKETAYYDKMLSNTESYLEQVKQQYEDTIDQIYDTWEKKITEGLGFDALNESLSRQKTLQDMILDSVESEYQLSKMQRDIDEKINKAANKQQKEKLKSFKQELEARKSGDALTANELKMMQAQLKVKMAEIELENAQNAKMTVTLQRDASGNFGYVYTADQSNVNQAQNNLEDAKYEQHEINKEVANSSAETIVQAESDLFSGLSALQKEYTTEDERNSKEYLKKQAQLWDDYYLMIETATKDGNAAILAEKSLAYTTSWKYITDEMTNMTGLKDHWTLNVAPKVNEATNDMNVKFGQATNEMGIDAEGLAKKIDLATASSEKLEKEMLGEDKSGESGVVGALKKQLTAASNLSDQYVTLGQQIDTVADQLEQLAIQAQNDITQKVNLEYVTKGRSAEEINQLLNEVEGLKEFKKDYEAEKTIRGWLNSKEGSHVRSGIKSQSSGQAAATLQKSAPTKSNPAVSNAITRLVNNGTLGQFLENEYGLSGNYVSSTKTFDTVYAADKNDNNGNNQQQLVTSNPMLIGKTRYIMSGVNGKETIKISYTNENGKKINLATQPEIDLLEDKVKENLSEQINKALSREPFEGEIVKYNNTYYISLPVDHGLMTSDIRKEWFRMQNVAKLTNSFDTGGYTGQWGPEGRLAMLHEKEIVLNKADTANFLEITKLLRELKLKQTTAQYQILRDQASQYYHAQTSDGINQNVIINAQFPNATNRNEIEAAFTNLANRASQYVMRGR